MISEGCQQKNVTYVTNREKGMTVFAENDILKKEVLLKELFMPQKRQDWQ